MAPPFLTLNRYLKGRFGFRVHKIPLDAGLSCPNRDGTKGRGGCIYCDAKGSGTGAARRGEPIPLQMERGIEWARSRYGARGFIAYFQAFSNTYGKQEHLLELYRQALISPEVVGLAIATRPDCVDHSILRGIKEVAQGRMVWMEYGLQSGHDSTLARINRGHTVAEFVEAVELTHRLGFPVCVHLIFGLPGEDRAMMMETVELIKGLGIEGVKFHQLYVVDGTPLARLYENGGYRPLTLDEYASLCAEAIRRLGPGVVIHRLNGDPPREGLLAPLWSRDKRRIREAILQGLKGP